MATPLLVASLIAHLAWGECEHHFYVGGQPDAGCADCVGCPSPDDVIYDTKKSADCFEDVKQRARGDPREEAKSCIEHCCTKPQKCKEKFVTANEEIPEGFVSCPNTRSLLVADGTCTSYPCKDGTKDTDLCCRGPQKCDEKFVSANEEKEGFVSCPKNSSLSLGNSSFSLGPLVLVTDGTCTSYPCTDSEEDTNLCCGAGFGHQKCNEKFVSANQQKEGYWSCPNSTNTSDLITDGFCSSKTCTDNDKNLCCGVDTADGANKLAVGLIVAWIMALQ